MTMGQQKDRQGDLMVGWAEMPRSPGHVFYDRLQSVLIEGFEGGLSVLLTREDGAAAVVDALAHTDQMIADVKASHPDIDIYISGGIAADAAFGSAALNEFTTLWPILYGIVLLVLIITLRAFFGTLATLVVIFMTSLVSIGACGWLNVPLNPTTIKAPILLLTLSVAHCVHILVTLYQEMRAGRTKHQAVIETLASTCSRYS